MKAARVQNRKDSSRSVTSLLWGRPSTGPQREPDARQCHRHSSAQEAAPRPAPSALGADSSAQLCPGSCEQPPQPLLPSSNRLRAIRLRLRAAIIGFISARERRRGCGAAPPATSAQELEPEGGSVQAAGRTCSRALRSACSAETCLNQRGKIASNPAVLWKRLEACEHPEKLSKERSAPELGKARSERRRITSVRNNNPFNCAHNYSFTSACWPPSKIVLPFFFFFSFMSR